MRAGEAGEIRASRHGALIGQRDPVDAASAAPAPKWPGQLGALLAVALITVLTFWPTLGNGFLSVAFDDAVILDTESIRSLSPQSVRAMATEFVHAHYVPLTMLSLAVDYQFWGLDARGYHLTNVLLHAATAVLVAVFLWPIMPSAAAAVAAALIFALHPVQMEAVSLAIQRKTLLSGGGFFLTLIFYQHWRRSGHGWLYAASVSTFAAAALAKPIVVTLPVVLWLYEYTFIDGRLRILDKLPFAAIAGGIAAAAVAAHVEVGGVHPPHGGNLLVHVLMMARVGLEYIAAVLLPANLSPIYYYQREMGYDPVNAIALAAILLLGAFVTARRRRYPWTFFCLAWFAVTLLPESNIVPLAQLRADRFLYLPMVGAGMWIAIGLDRLPPISALGRLRRLPTYAAGLAVVATLAVITHGSAGVWRSDVSAWRRVVERHPWSGTAYTMLGHAHAARGDSSPAEAAYLGALQRDRQLARPNLELARLYYASGHLQAADARLHRFLELEPGHPQGLALLDAMRGGGP